MDHLFGGDSTIVRAGLRENGARNPFDGHPGGARAASRRASGDSGQQGDRGPPLAYTRVSISRNSTLCTRVTVPSRARFRSARSTSLRLWTLRRVNTCLT